MYYSNVFMLYFYFQINGTGAVSKVSKENHIVTTSTTTAATFIDIDVESNYNIRWVNSLII